ncbi:SDR family oxidoreductase [Chitinophaga sp. CF418]|uniref:SDR family oxidoreductase n=1 Tax=Chitinophaga sp. CF418 TaxID=1855287 RepID=UPI0009198191|nr:SDR family oxidoreductase [Chitinophaga sp. CF418]SHN34144.1 NADP-dependent 3-hydroxy acid dehydrogenase YdfG [Chitinophaga sp. CF418]
MKKVIVITGSSTGFGALMARTFSREGYTVIATMREVNGKNAGAAKELGSLPNTEVVELDVTSDTSVKSAISQVLEKYQQIDVLINNAAVFSGGLLEAFSVEQVKRVFDANVFSVLRVNNEVLPAMRAAKDGLIITISSSVGRVSPPFQAPYNATKFAIEGFVEASYAELIGQGIETVLIEPGAFLTEIWGKSGIGADRQGIAEAYGEATADLQKHIESVFGKVLQEKKPNPQLIADTTLRLVKMEKGKRPLRTPIDPSANGADVAYNEATINAAAHWKNQYGL